MGTIIRNVHPIGRHSPNTTITFEDRRFVAFAQAESQQQMHAEQLDAAGKLAIPGFINAHTHLPMVLFRGLADDVPLQTWLEQHIWPLERLLQPEDIYWCALLGIAEGIRSGTTAFVDMYFHNDEIARAVEESGVRCLMAYGMIAPSLQEGGAAELEKTESLIRRWHGAADDRIQVSVSPHAVYTCGEDVIRAAVDMARKYETSLHTHVAETRSEVEDWKSKTGLTPVRYLQELDAFSVPTLAAHCVHVDSDDIAILAEHPVTVAHCPKSNAKLGSGMAPIPAMRQAGVSVAIGTDGAASNNRLDMIEELRCSWIVQRAFHEDPSLLNSSDVVSMAIDGARPLFGLPADGFAPGSPADLVLLDTNHLHTTPPHDGAAMIAYAVDSRNVTDVYVDGKALLKKGELRTIDEERVISEVRRLLHRLKNR